MPWWTPSTSPNASSRCAVRASTSRPGRSADDAARVEIEGSPGGASGNVKGLDAIREKWRRWAEDIEAIGRHDESGPVIAGKWFSVASSLDATCRSIGWMPKQEICAYQERDGKIVHEQFFYNT